MTVYSGLDGAHKLIGDTLLTISHSCGSVTLLLSHSQPDDVWPQTCSHVGLIKTLAAAADAKDEIQLMANGLTAKFFFFFFFFIAIRRVWLTIRNRGSRLYRPSDWCVVCYDVTIKT